MTEPTPDRPSRFMRRMGTIQVAAVAASLLTALVLTLAALPARGSDGCQVLLCLAAPSWRDIPMCVPVVQRVLRDVARGKPFPVCTMSGHGNTAIHDWASPPTFCPPQYTRVYDGANDGASPPRYECDYLGAILVQVNGAPFTRTWWNATGDTVTEFSPAAKAQLGRWNTRFDDDYARWFATQPPVQAPTPDMP
jgi:hypothetical protein